MRDFSRPLSKLQVIARNSDWFIALFAPNVIGRSDYFGIGFRQPFDNRSVVLSFVVTWFGHQRFDYLLLVFIRWWGQLNTRHLLWYAGFSTTQTTAYLSQPHNFVLSTADVGNNACGLGFNGYDSNGKELWNRVTNVNVVELEVSRNPFYVILCSFLSFSIPHYVFIWAVLFFERLVFLYRNCGATH